MQKLKNFQLTSKAVSGLLMAAIALLVLIAGTGSWFMQGMLTDAAIATDHAKIDADLNQTEIDRSKTLQAYLEKNKAAVDKAATVVSDTKTYQYQNQIVNDIQTYAGKAGVTVLGYSFPQDTTAAKPDATGLKSVTASLTLQSPVPYTNFLTFLKYIEQNVTKMQVTTLTLTPDPNNPNNLQTSSVVLKVYVR